MIFYDSCFLAVFFNNSSITKLVCRTDWTSAKILLGDSNFLKRLYEYDKDNMPDAMLKKLKKYVDNPKFVPDAVEKVSKVCDLLCLHFELWTNYGT